MSSQTLYLIGAVALFTGLALVANLKAGHDLLRFLTLLPVIAGTVVLFWLVALAALALGAAA